MCKKKVVLSYIVANWKLDGRCKTPPTLFPKIHYEVITARDYCDHVTRTEIYVTLRDMTRSHVTIVTTINFCVSISGQMGTHM